MILQIVYQELLAKESGFPIFRLSLRIVPVGFG